jgi:predicted MFS family arabinose efflux permease
MSSPKSRTSTLPSPSTRIWLVSMMVLFLLHGLFFSSWVSRSPEVQSLLGLSTFHMGIFVTVMSVGSILGTYVGVKVVSWIGARVTFRITYVALSGAYIFLGFSATAGDVLISSAMIFLVGFSASVGGLANNLEGARLEHISPRSILPSLHGMFSLGMLVGSGIGALVISLGISVSSQFLGIGILVAIAGFTASFGVPGSPSLKHHDNMSTAEMRQVPSKAEWRNVWRERRTLTIAFIGMTFVIAETSAANWLPIALVDGGMNETNAALAFMFFAIAMTIGRFVGGFVIDRLGRVRTTIIISAVASVGILIVMANNMIHLSYLGALLWGLGCSLGFPIAVSALSDDQRMAAPRVNSLVMTVQTANLGAGPTLGALGQAFGLFAAFTVPVALLVGSMVSSGATSPLSRRTPTPDADTSTDVVDVVQVIAQREVDDF